MLFPSSDPPFLLLRPPYLASMESHGNFRFQLLCALSLWTRRCAQVRPTPRRQRLLFFLRPRSADADACSALFRIDNKSFALLLLHGRWRSGAGQHTRRDQREIAPPRRAERRCKRGSSQMHESGMQCTHRRTSRDCAHTFSAAVACLVGTCQRSRARVFAYLRTLTARKPHTNKSLYGAMVGTTHLVKFVPHPVHRDALRPAPLADKSL